MAPAPVEMQDQRAELDTSWGAMIDGVSLRQADAQPSFLQVCEVSRLCTPPSVLGPALLKEQRLMHGTLMCHTQVWLQTVQGCNLGDALSVVHVVKSQHA
jgi:hypothetical protein